MPSSPLTRVPTDVMYMVFDLLRLDALCDFRLVCRWAQEQSFKYIAIRAYSNVYINSGRESMVEIQRAERVFRKNTALADYVRTLHIQWVSSRFTKMQGVQPPYLFEPSSVVPALPKLKRLELHNLNGFDLDPYFRLPPRRSEVTGLLSFDALGSDWPRLDYLLIKNACLSSNELIAVVARASLALTELQLEHVNLGDDDWLNALWAVYDMAPIIESLKLWDLCHQPNIAYGDEEVEQYTFRNETQAILKKSYDSERGTAALILQRKGASMMGAEVIGHGLNMIEEHVAAQR
ncbi:hypothetical protein LTR10_010432 [Elasticomyces elasticus]|nr:hypothetical protein LTR10_010432 [Elasticomyces elasticus]KAK4972332.1 hypothetical protein LTR42_006840 [Elasticomyces elasticus]